MAESDAAGPGSPGGPKSRALTREDLDRLLDDSEREWAALTPEEKAQRKAETEKADREAFEKASRAMRPTLEALERSTASAAKAFDTAWQLPQLAAGTFDPPRGIGHDPSDRDRALAEILDAVEPARPLRAEDVRKAVADGVREALAEAAPKPATNSERLPTTPAGGLFTGGAAWQAGQAALFVARAMQELETAPAEQPPATTQRPLFELDPSKRLLDALREAFPSFTPTDQWWLHVERELKDAHKRSNPEGHDDFLAAYRIWSADDLVRHLETTGWVKRPRTPRGDTTCERLRDLHVNVDPEFAETVSERLLGERIEREPGTFPSSHYWRTVLQPKRREVKAKIREGKQKMRDAQRWGHFDSVGRRDEGPEDH